MLRAVQMMMIASPATTTFSSSSSSFGLLRIKSLHLHHRQFLISSTSTTNSLTPKPKPPSFLSLSTRNNTTHCFKPFIRMSNSTRSESTPSASVSPGNIHKVKFCQWCGGPCKHEIPNGEEKIRAICSLCGKIAYQNPKMVVGCLIEHENKILLCKRNIQPSLGRWTLPVGFMEMGESATEGAIRETQEEAGAEVEVLSPFAQLDIPLIGQTYIIFLAKLKKPHFSPGPESIECRLFPLDEIPFDSLAFSSMVVTLKLYVEDMKAGKPRFHYGTISKRPGTSPSDIHAFSLDYHLQS